MVYIRNARRVLFFVAVCAVVLSISMPVRAGSVINSDTDVEAREVQAASARMRPGINNTNAAQQLNAQATPIWPAGSADLITSFYGYRVHPIYGDIRFHYGLDIGVGEGTPVVAPLAGTVTSIQWNDAVGNVVEIDHGGGVVTRYCHLSSWQVPAGQNVVQGQQFARSGSTGYLSTGPHLHFEVYDYVHSDNAFVPPYFTYQRNWTVDPLAWLNFTAEPEPPTTGNTFALLDNFGVATTFLWTATASAGSIPPNIAWYSGMGGFDATRAKMTTGDFNHDGFLDVAMLYDYGGATSRIWLFMWDGSSYVPYEAWYSGPGKFDASKAKITCGYFNADTDADVAILFDYGGGTSRVWTFLTDGTTMAPTLAWSSSPGGFDASRVKMASGEFDGQNNDDIAMFYNYGGGTSRIWTFLSQGATFKPNLAWSSSPGGFDAARIKIVAGQFDGANNSDIAALYDYGGGTSRFWTFLSNGMRLSSNLAWSSSPGGFDAAKTKIASGEFNGQNYDDVAVVYDYGEAGARIWSFNSDGPRLSPSLAWVSGNTSFYAGECEIEAP